MFRGANAINLDAKGRIAMPARYREQLVVECAGSMVVTKDLFDPCLLLFPIPEWESLETKLAGLSSTNRQHRAIKHILLGHATDIELDKNSRFLVPPSLRQLVGLEKHLFLVGNGRSFQIWDEAQWNSQIEDDLALVTDQSLDSEQLPDLSF
ncbi:MAG TPA: transcriptional regulator MraZ [Aeromonadales bacterium]|nr:transcriptional regulator MraZ [Aeromonadales bacterium]